MKKLWPFPILLLLASSLAAQTFSGGSKGQPDEWVRITFDGDVTIGWNTGNGGCTPEPCHKWNIVRNGWEPTVDLEDVASDNSGFTVPTDLDNGVDDTAQYQGNSLVPSVETLADHIAVELVDVGGTRKNVLKQTIIDDQIPGQSNDARSEYRVRLSSWAETGFNDGYIAYDIYFTPDLATQNCTNAVFCFFGMGEIHDFDDTETDRWRISHGISRMKQEDDAWRWRISYSEYDPCCGNNWTDRYDTTDVTGGQWYRYEYEWVSHASAGTIKVWIDGLQIFDYSGQTADAREEIIPVNKKYFDMLSLYSDAYLNDDEVTPQNLWTYIDNVVLCGSRAECG